MTDETVVVEARDLRRRFGDVVALDGIELTIGRGEIFGLLGPNGAGKTTTVRILTTLDRADSGSARIANLDVAASPDAVRARIGYVPQELTADKYLTARESLDFFCRLYHLPATRRQRRIDELIALLGLEEAADRLLRTFSGGMKKKLDLACGLVHEPELLFLDEPSLGLDVQVRRALWDHVEQLRERGTTVVLCTNQMDEADRLCDRLAIIDRGRVVIAGTPGELRAGLGGDVVSLGFTDADSPAVAAERLAKLAVVTGSFGDGLQLHLTVTANETALPTLLDATREAGLRVESAAYHRPGLEEVFLKHTGRRFAEAQGLAGPPPRRRGSR